MSSLSSKRVTVFLTKKIKISWTAQRCFQMFEPKIISVYNSIFCCIKINLLWFSLKIFIGGKIKLFLNTENAK